MKFPAFWSAVIFIIGIWIGRSLNLPDLILFLVAIAAFVAGLVIYLKQLDKYAWFIIAAALFIAGIFRVNLDGANLPNNDISHFNDLGKYVTVRGEIVREPDLRPGQTFLTLRADTIIIENTSIPTSGLILVRLKFPSSAFNYADYIQVSGYLSAPLPARNPGAFDYRKYLSNKNIRCLIAVKQAYNIRRIHTQTGNIFLTKLIIPLRSYILSVFDRNLSETHNALISGFLIGETRFIPPEIFKNFRDTGTLHLLAVSGSNVALVISTIAGLLMLVRIPLRIRYLLSFFEIIIFCYLSYNQPSVIRASAMVGLYLIGRLAYRKVSYVSVIATAAIVILMFEPLMLWDVGFQLSFAAAFGLIYLLPIIFSPIKIPNKRRWIIPKFLLMILFSSLIAQLSVAPILAYSFNTIPTIGIISNLVIVPLSSIAVILALLLCLVGWFIPLAQVLGFIADKVLGWTIASVNYFAGLPVVKINLSSPDWYYIILYYLILILLFNLLVNRKVLKYLIISLLVAGNIVIWNQLCEGRHRKSQLTVLDSGGNQLIHFKTERSENCLFSSCNPNRAYDPAERVLLPYLISQHIGVIDNYISMAVDSLPYMAAYLENNNIKIQNYSASKDLSDMKTEKYYYRFMWNQNTIVILTDLEALPELANKRSDSVAILILPEPQYFDRGINDLIVKRQPSILVFSGYESLYVEPAGYDGFLEICRENGISCYNTRENGAITIIFEPSGMAVKPHL